MNFSPAICRLAILIAMLISSEVTLAQLKIIPQSKLDSVANPRVVGADKMLFKGSAVVDFATLDEDAQPWQKTLEWQNKASETISITRITSSCSCLRGEFERGGVKVGQSGRVKITYYPKGHPGAVNQRLFVYTNLSASVPTVILTVKGVVKASKDHRADYKYSRGALLLRQDTLYATLGKATQCRVACMNSSDKEMRLSEDTLLSSRGVKMWTEPHILPAGAEGDLVVSVSADAHPAPRGVGGGFPFGGQIGTNKTENGAKDCLSLYIKGLSLPARERMLVIRLKE